MQSKTAVSNKVAEDSFGCKLNWSLSLGVT